MPEVSEFHIIKKDTFVNWVIEAIEFPDVSIYTYMAHKLLNIPIEEVTLEQRKHAKETVYKCMYETSIGASLYTRLKELFPNSGEFELSQLFRNHLENRRREFIEKCKSGVL